MSKPGIPQCSCSCEQNPAFDHLVMLLIFHTTHAQIAEILGEGNFQCRKLRSEEDGTIVLGAVATTAQNAALLAGEYGMIVIDSPALAAERALRPPEEPIPSCSCDAHKMEMLPEEFTWMVVLNDQFTTHEQVAAVIGEGNFCCNGWQKHEDGPYVLRDIWTTEQLALFLQEEYSQDAMFIDFAALVPPDDIGLPSGHVTIREGEESVIDLRAVPNPATLFDRCSG